MTPNIDRTDVRWCLASLSFGINPCATDNG